MSAALETLVAGNTDESGDEDNNENDVDNDVIVTERQRQSSLDTDILWIPNRRPKKQFKNLRHYF